MTVERWKDVLRGSTKEVGEDEYWQHPSVHDAEDIAEPVLELVWKPIMSATGALWNVTRVFQEQEQQHGTTMSAGESRHSGVLGGQGARLGMEVSMEMLNGVGRLSRIDILLKFLHGFAATQASWGSMTQTLSKELGL